MTKSDRVIALLLGVAIACIIGWVTAAAVEPGPVRPTSHEPGATIDLGDGGPAAE